MEPDCNREPGISHGGRIVRRLRRLLLALENHAAVPDLDRQPGGAGGGSAGRRVPWPRTGAVDHSGGNRGGAVLGSLGAASGGGGRTRGGHLNAQGQNLNDGERFSGFDVDRVSGGWFWGPGRNRRR